MESVVGSDRCSFRVCLTFFLIIKLALQVKRRTDMPTTPLVHRVSISRVTSTSYPTSHPGSTPPRRLYHLHHLRQQPGREVPPAPPFHPSHTCKLAARTYEELSRHPCCCSRRSMPEVLPLGWGRRCTDANPQQAPSQFHAPTQRREGRECVPQDCGAVRMCACDGLEQAERAYRET